MVIQLDQLPDKMAAAAVKMTLKIDAIFLFAKCPACTGNQFVGRDGTVISVYRPVDLSFQFQDTRQFILDSLSCSQSYFVIF